MENLNSRILYPVTWTDSPTLHRERTPVQAECGGFSWVLQNFDTPFHEIGTVWRMEGNKQRKRATPKGDPDLSPENWMISG